MHAEVSRYVLFLQGSSGFGGSKVCLLNLLEAVKMAGYKPVVACPDRGWLTDQLDHLEIDYVLLPFYAWRKFFDRPRVRPSIRKQWIPSLARWQFNIVHSNEFWWGPHAVELAKLIEAPAVVHLRDGHHTLKKARQYQLAGAQAIVASSSELRQKFAPDPLIHDRTMVIFDGHRERTFHEGREKARDLFRLGPDDITLGSAGTLSERKNQRLLLHAVANLKHRLPDLSIKVLIAGDAIPSYGQVLKREIQQLGLAANVQLLGHLTEMGSFYAAIDIFVHSARREGLPSVVPEAMFSKKPIVATAAEGVGDALPDERFGCVVPIDDRAALERQIERLLLHPELCKAMGEQAFERAHQCFSLKALQENTAKLYSNIVQKHTAGCQLLVSE